MGDRSIIQRLDPDNVCKVQYLHRDTALFAEDEWVWKYEREGAWVFDTHAEAEKFARECPYEIGAGRVHTFPHAVVLGSPQLDEERVRRHANQMATMEASVVNHVAPEEAYERTRKLLGERD